MSQDPFVRQPVPPIRYKAMPRRLPGDPEEKCLDCGHRRYQHFSGCGGKPKPGAVCCECEGFAVSAPAPAKDGEGDKP